MINKYKNIFIILISLFILYIIIINKEIVSNQISYSLHIWVSSLIPSLFPFFVISDILISYNFIHYIPSFIKNIFKKILSISDEMLSILILSLVSGFPSNARNTKNYFDIGLITIDDANRILMFTHFANPLFIISTTSIFFLKNEKLGIIILLSIYISNFITGLIVRSNYTSINKNNSIITNNNFGNIFISSLKKSINTLLLILGILSSFLVLSSCILYIIPLGSYNRVILKGILEITMGLKDLGLLNISYLSKTIIATIFLSFGGLSVHMQVIGEITDTPIKYKYFLYGRIISTSISIPVCYILYRLFI